MKKIITLVLTFVFALSINVGVSALEQGVSQQVDSQFIKEDDLKSSKKSSTSNNIVKPSKLDNGIYKVITSGDMTTINSNEYKWSKVDGIYTDTSYYKKINNMWINYKNSYSSKSGGKTVTFTAIYQLDSNGNVVNLNGYRVIKTQTRDEKYTADNKWYSYSKINYSTKNPSASIALYDDYRLYHSNGEISSKSIYYRNESNQLTKTVYYTYDTNGKLKSKSLSKKNTNEKTTFTDYRTYYTNGKVKIKSLAYYTANGNHKKSNDYSYNKKGKLTRKTLRNSKYYTTYSEGRSYYKNGKMKVKAIFKYNGKSSYLTKSGKWYKYRTNGKKQYYKKQVYNKKGYITRMDTYSYNKKGQKKSNKYGNAYKYKTYFKSNSILIKKVTKAKYSKKGKLGSAYKVKATKLTKTYYY